MTRTLMDFGAGVWSGTGWYLGDIQKFAWLARGQACRASLGRALLHFRSSTEPLYRN